MNLAVALLAALPLAACVTDPDLATALPGDPEITPAVTKCPQWGCGENSPVMGPYEFHELNTNGVPDLNNITVIDFVKAGVSYHPVVVGAKLYAVDASNNVISGVALKGGWFDVKTPTGTYKLDITSVNVEGMAYWLGTPTPNETFDFQYEAPGDPKAYELCNIPPARIPGDPANHTWGNPYEAILFTGDRYDATTKTVTASTYQESDGWFNIACAGSAVAKLHLNRHTTAGSPGPGGVTTTWQQRQALLKMFVSDVCGTGQAFTVKGTPLDWQNTLGWQVLNPNDFAHEAYWNETGALCLDTHRLGTQQLEAIHAVCKPMACPVLAPATTYLSSAVPFPVD